MRRATAALCALTALGCAPAPVLERAFAARGGALDGFRREAEVRVYYGFPGLWRWEMAFLAPEHYRFTLITDADPQHYVFDGAVGRSFVGTRLVTVDRSEAPALRSHARWMAITSLDVLADSSRVTLAEFEPPGAVAGAARALRARFRDEPDVYELYFDRAGRLIGAEGPISIPGLGAGRLRARFTDFRAVDGFVVPFATRYSLDGEPFFDERVVRFVPNDPALDAAGFERPPAR
ncbi:MAG: hypothetical protein JSU66_15055 [Deltaproteobacteria bacterium]|nr:MAG: hypothetical protein JSU66_15055 [Deltaproteobacteria bacterium]